MSMVKLEVLDENFPLIKLNSHLGSSIIDIKTDAGNLRVIVYDNGELKIITDNNIKWKDASVEKLEETFKLARLSKIYAERANLESWGHPF